MLDEQGTTLARLASHWSRPGAPPQDLVTETRDALSTAQPGDLVAVAGLVETLLGRTHAPESRQAARRALFALLDTARRRFFTQALRPDQVADWTRLLLTAIERAKSLYASGHPVVLAGDYNVMPTDLDVYAAKRWVDDALFRRGLEFVQR